MSEYKSIIIPSGSTFNNARIDFNGIEFNVPKENQYDFGTRSVKFGDFEIISVADRSKEATIPPFNTLQKTINGFPVTYGTIVNVRLIKNVPNSIRNALVIYTSTSQPVIDINSQPASKSFSTPGKVILGILTIAAILGGLKWAKVI